MSYSGPADIDVRRDGIYILIDPNSETVFQDVLEIIQKSGIKDANLQAVEEAVLLKKEEVKLSTNTELLQRSEDVEIRVDVSKMKVEIKFTPPLNRGNLLDKKTVINRLNNVGITFGIKEEYLEELMKNKSYTETYVVAEGMVAVDSIDGYLEFLFDTGKKTLKPKELPNGTVDYRLVDLFDMAMVGQKLVRSHAPVEGHDGMNVFGKILVSKKGKLPPLFPKGKNVVVSEDGQYLVAECAGRIAFLEGKVNIQPILELNGNVDNSTGNIDFLGTVIIKGDVVTGFTVSAGGNIEISGNVEGATIKANGDLLLSKGVQGAGKAFIYSGGNIAANFIESATVVAAGSINANYIMHSTVSCGGSLELMGRRAVLVGGKYTVGDSVTARVIGSSMASVTELEVGLDPNKLREYRELVQKVEELNKEYATTEKIIEVLSKVKIEELPDVRKKVLVDSIRNKIVLKSKINAYQTKIAELLPQLSGKNGSVKVSDVVYSGVKVMIGNAVLYVHDNIAHCTFMNQKGKVIIGSY